MTAEHTLQGFRIVVSLRSHSFFVFAIIAGFWNYVVFGKMIWDERPQWWLVSLFALGGVWLAALAGMTLCGNVRVELAGDELSVLTGFGEIGWISKTSWRSIRGLSEEIDDRGETTSITIVLEGEPRVRFGSLLTAGKRKELLRALGEQLTVRRN